MMGSSSRSKTTSIAAKTDAAGSICPPRMSEYEFGYHPRASRQAAKLPSDDDERIRSKLVEMVTNEWRDLFDYDVDTVSGTDLDIYRTRIGEYRVFFVVDGRRCVILHIDRREGAYGNVSTLEERADEGSK